MKGPGKYDDICTVVREKTQANCAIVIVIDGMKGCGFSVQAIWPDLADKLPQILRYIANNIENDRNKDKSTAL